MIEWVTDIDIIRGWTDDVLVAAYQRTDGAGAQADALAAEIERRNLDL